MNGGELQQFTVSPDEHRHVNLAPDGRRFVFMRSEDISRIAVFDDQEPLGKLRLYELPPPSAGPRLPSCAEELARHQTLLGLPGSLAAAAFLTESLERAVYQRTGFNGLMLPVLEDAVLAHRAAERTFSLNELLLYSAVCGTGLDTIPLTGDASPAQLAAVLLDLAALALRLDKPLTARLMPIPGKAAGDSTGFDFAFFANSRVMPLTAQPLGGLWQSQPTFSLNPRRK